MDWEVHTLFFQSFIGHSKYQGTAYEIFKKIRYG